MTAIRKISAGDLESLQSISRQTFSETFSLDNTPENMEKYLSENFSREKLTAELNDPYSEFYFAEKNHRVIGYLKINRGPSQTALQDDISLEIERIYVLKEFHGQEAGKILFDTAVKRAKELHATYIWLGVWEKNPRAIAFYRKNGFVEFDKHIFVLGDDEQTDIMMRLPL